MKNCEYQQIDPRGLSTPSSTQPYTENNVQRPRRKWEVFPGKNRFYCDGRIILARQSGILPLTLGLIIVTSGLFFAFDCPFLVTHLTVCIPVIGGVLFVFVVTSLLQTSFTDPGILPRTLPDEAADIEKQIDTSGSSTYHPPPRTKEILINQQVVKLKYCFTCKMFRPPRTSHCSMCDNCGAVRSPLPVGGELCGQAQLPLLLQLHSLSLLPHHLHFRLCRHTPHATIPRREWLSSGLTGESCQCG